LAGWTDDELASIAGANELAVAPLRDDDGTLQSPRIVWVIRRGDDVYIRSVNGLKEHGSEVCKRTAQGTSLPAA
jgi:hypothetical protein